MCCDEQSGISLSYVCETVTLDAAYMTTKIDANFQEELAAVLIEGYSNERMMHDVARGNMTARPSEENLNPFFTIGLFTN